MTVRAVVHIGPTKTGSTALAFYLTKAHVTGLLPPSTIYPLGELWFGIRSKPPTRQDRALGQFVGDGKTTPFGFAQRGVPEAIERVALTLRSLPGDGDKTAVFIAETITAVAPVALVQKAFAESFDEVVFVMFARRQDKAGASLMSQLVKTRDIADINLDPRRAKLFRGLPFGGYDHLANYQRWVNGPSNVRLVVVPYLEGEQGSFRSIERFFTAAGLGAPAELAGIEGRRIHPTLSRDGLEALIALKRGVKRWGWIPGVKKRFEEQFQQTTAMYLSSARAGGIEPSGRTFVPWSLTESDARWVLDQFDASNRELLALVREGPFSADWDTWEAALA